MKVRESGMPEERLWASFFDVPKVLEALEVAGAGDVVELGSGYGTFTLPAAKAISGRITALDIEPHLVGLVRRRALDAGLANVTAALRDFMRDGTGLEDASVDYVMLFNILHAERPDLLLREAFRILRPGGRLGIIHWNYDPSTPRGPPMDIRPRPEQCRGRIIDAGFCLLRSVDLRPYHYGLLFARP